MRFEMGNQGLTVSDVKVGLVRLIKYADSNPREDLLYTEVKARQDRFGPITYRVCHYIFGGPTPQSTDDRLPAIDAMLRPLLDDLVSRGILTRWYDDSRPLWPIVRYAVCSDYANKLSEWAAPGIEAGG